jgi:hypothetical protein
MAGHGGGPAAGRPLSADRGALPVRARRLLVGAALPPPAHAPAVPGPRSRAAAVGRRLAGPVRRAGEPEPAARRHPRSRRSPSSTSRSGTSSCAKSRGARGT